MRTRRRATYVRKQLNRARRDRGWLGGIGKGRRGRVGPAYFAYYDDDDIPDGAEARGLHVVIHGRPICEVEGCSSEATTERGRLFVCEACATDWGL
jgi:hypothetical protein